MAPPNFVPPQLAPSVEEAYRRKCIQLKQRTQEVEEANDAARIRIARTIRQIEKKRIERALLLEQMQRRMSTNVEDSEGSPSPPPTPEEKPLRSKRGHRKTSLLPPTNNAPSSIAGGADGNGEHAGGPSSLNASATFLSQAATSPGSDTFSHTNADIQSQNLTKVARSNGNASGSANARPTERGAPTAYELYAAQMRPILEEKHKDDDAFIVDEALSASWGNASSDERDEWKLRAKEAAERSKSKEASEPAQEDEDVEMGDNDTEAAPSISGDK